MRRSIEALFEDGSPQELSEEWEMAQAVFAGTPFPQLPETSGLTT